MRVAFRALRCAMAEELAGEVEALAREDRVAGIGVAEIMGAERGWKACLFLECRPGSSDRASGPIRVGRGWEDVV